MNKLGGLDYYIEQSKLKSELLWSFIDNCDQYYHSKIVDKDYRSRINVIFRIQGGNTALEDQFI